MSKPASGRRQARGAERINSRPVGSPRDSPRKLEEVGPGKEECGDSGVSKESHSRSSGLVSSSPRIWLHILLPAAIRCTRILAMAPRKPTTTAEVALVPLKSCLVNLPSSLVSMLVNANAVSCACGS